MCLFGFCFVPKSDESSDDFSNESSDDKEDEESEEISIYYFAVWTRSCSFACSIAALQIVDLQGLATPYSYRRTFQLVSFILLFLIVLFLIRSSSLQASS